MQGVVWSSFPLELNSILQVRTGYGQAPPETLKVVPGPGLISSGRWRPGGTLIRDTGYSWMNPARIRIFRTAIKAPASILSLLYYFPFGSKRGSTLKFGHPRAVS